MISYRPLWETMKHKNITTYALVEKYHISSATMSRIRHGGDITTRTLDDLCTILDCRVQDILEYEK